MGMSIETIMRLHKTVIVWLGGSVVCDVGMTVGIIFIVRRSSGRSQSHWLTDIMFVARALQEAHGI